MTFGGANFSLAAFPEVPEAAKTELGSTFGRPQMTGFVFINGRYLPPPYTVTRIGNGIFINRIQVMQPVPWSRSHPQAEQGKEVDSDGDFEAVGENDVEEKPVEKPAVKRSAPKRSEKSNSDEAPDAPDDISDGESSSVGSPSNSTAMPASASDLDDLFEDEADSGGKVDDKAEKEAGDEAEGEEAAADATKKVPSKSVSLDNLFDEDAATTPSGKKAAEEEKNTEQGDILPAKKIKREKALLKAKLDRMRSKFEKGLANNEIYFFSYSQPFINGNYGTARTLIGVLPDALRVSNSWYQLKQHLERGGVYFLPDQTIQAIYHHKASYPTILERLRRIKTDEALEKARRERSGRMSWGTAY